jgi:sodium transport system permease protein
MSQAKKARERKLKVGLILNGNTEEFKQMLLESDGVKIVEGISVDEGKALVTVDSLDAVIVLEPEFDKRVEDLASGRIDLYFRAPERRSIERNRLSELMESLEKRLRSIRFENLKLDESIIETIDVSEHNLATMKERIAEVVGGFLPYLFIIFCFTGSMYPAIDLAAGEKERGTLETLLTSPAGRAQILLGKFWVVVLTGILAAIISIVGMYIGVLQMREIPAELLKTILTILEFRSIALLISLLFPLTVFFAAILLSLSIFAKSFKEAQSIITPMMLLVIIPAFIGLLPGMKLTTQTAIIPILNVSLATKAIIAGTISGFLLTLVYASLVIYAAVSLYACSKLFKLESTLFRG